MVHHELSSIIHSFSSLICKIRLYPAVWARSIKNIKSPCIRGTSSLSQRLWPSDCHFLSPQRLGGQKYQQCFCLSFPICMMRNMIEDPPYVGIKCDPESREFIWHIIGTENCERWATAQPQAGSTVCGEPTTAPDHPTPPACRMLALLPTLCVSSSWRGQPSCPAQNRLPDTYPGYVLWFAAKRENILKHKRAEVTGSTNVESPRDAKSFLAPHFLWRPLKLQKDGALGFPPLGSGFAVRRSEHICDFLP